MIQGDRPGTHIVNAWPDNALKVVSKTPLKPNTWQHVCVVYDGSGKAAGVKVYIDGVLGSPLDDEVKRVMKETFMTPDTGPDAGDLRTIRQKLLIVRDGIAGDVTLKAAKGDLIAHAVKEQRTTTRKEALGELSDARAKELSNSPAVAGAVNANAWSSPRRTSRPVSCCSRCSWRGRRSCSRRRPISARSSTSRTMPRRRTRLRVRLCC